MYECSFKWTNFQKWTFFLMSQKNYWNSQNSTSFDMYINNSWYFSTFLNTWWQVPKYQQKMLKWLIRKGRDLTEARKDTFAKPAKPVSSQGPPCLLVLFCLHSYHTCWEYPPVHSENESRIFWYPLLPLQNNYSRNCL